MLTLITALLIKRYLPKIPNLLIGLIVGSFVALYFSNGGHNIQLVGEIPAHLPPLSLPDFSFAAIKMLAPEAFAVALLGLIEAVSISRAIATKSNQRIDANQEFIGQGLSNLTGSFFSLVMQAQGHLPVQVLTMHPVLKHQFQQFSQLLY